MLRKRKEPKAEKSVAEALLRDMQGPAVVGREGMADLPIVDGADRSPCETSVQVEGEAQCISAQHLRLVMDQSMTMLKCFLRYAHAFLSPTRGRRYAMDVSRVPHAVGAVAVAATTI